MAKPKFFQWFAYDVRTVATDCSGMSGEQEATYHRLMRYLWDEGPQMEAVLRGRSFGNWDAISHCFTDHGTGLSLGWLEEYRAKANGTSERQRSNRGSTTVQPRLNNGKSTELPSREEEEEEKESKSKKERKALFSNSRFVELQECESALPELVSEGVSLQHYLDAIRNWSDAKGEQRTTGVGLQPFGNGPRRIVTPVSCGRSVRYLTDGTPAPDGG